MKHFLANIYMFKVRIATLRKGMKGVEGYFCVDFVSY